MSTCFAILRYRALSFFVVFLLFAMSIASCGQKEESASIKVETDTIPATGGEDSLTIALTGRDSVTVFDLLVESHQVDYAQSSMGVFIKTIDSVTNSSGVFWLYSINDSMASVAADKYITKDNDRVIWHFRKLSQ
jgi:hypothetical protein